MTRSLEPASNRHCHGASFLRVVAVLLTTSAGTALAQSRPTAPYTPPPAAAPHPYHSESSSAPEAPADLGKRLYYGGGLTLTLTGSVEPENADKVDLRRSIGIVGLADFRFLDRLDLGAMAWWQGLTAKGGGKDNSILGVLGRVKYAYWQMPAVTRAYVLALLGFGKYLPAASGEDAEINFWYGAGAGLDLQLTPEWQAFLEIDYQAFTANVDTKAGPSHTVDYSGIYLIVGVKL